ncbi:MAG: thioredoxin family protein [Candidatus Binatia bacterium]
MRRTLMTAILATAIFAAAASFALQLGDPPPERDVKMKSVDGRNIAIADVAGARGTLVIFSCNHCPWVKAWEPRIADLGNAYAQRGIGVIAINANDPAGHKEDRFDHMVTRARERGFQFPYVVDSGSRVAKAFGASRTPEVFLFDGAGRLVYHGAIDDNAQDATAVKHHYLREALEAVATEKPVAVGQTKALGCGIKFYGS